MNQVFFYRAACPQYGVTELMSPHSATELEADSGFLLQLRDGVALQVPELGIVPSVSGQESKRHLRRHEHQRKQSECLTCSYDR